MEIMVRMDDGTIREYAVPSYAGMSYTTEASEGVTTTFAAVDDVAAVGVAFAFDPERGGTVSRQIIPWAGRELAEDGPATVAASEDEAVCIITPEEAAHVTEVRVDGGSGASVPGCRRARCGRGADGRRSVARPVPAGIAAPDTAAPVLTLRQTGPVAPGSAGELKLYDTDPRTAAMLMAIVADELQAPLNELRFLSIREIKEEK